MKKLFGIVVAILMVTLFLGGCPVDDSSTTNETDPGTIKPDPDPIKPDPDPIKPSPDPISGNPTGTESASADGFASTPSPDYMGQYGDGEPVEVTVTVTNGYITEVKIDGPTESPELGGLIIKEAPAKIIAENTFDIPYLDIDVTSGATFTINAIKKAGQEALDKIIANNKE